jgi:hypothetical protein
VPLVEPRLLIPRVDEPPRAPRPGVEYLDVGLEETVVGGWSIKEVSVVLDGFSSANTKLESQGQVAKALTKM